MTHHGHVSIGAAEVQVVDKSTISSAGVGGVHLCDPYYTNMRDCLRDSLSRSACSRAGIALAEIQAELLISQI